MTIIEENRVCNKCAYEKEINDFRCLRENYYLKTCKECINLEARNRRAEKGLTPGRPKKYSTKEEARKAGIIKATQWRKNNREQYLETSKKRREENPEYFKKKNK